MSLATPVKGRHPRALYVLFLTEMWERFAYYLLAGILLLYLKDGKQFTPKGCRYHRHFSGADLAAALHRRDDRRPVFGLYQIHFHRRQPAGGRLPGPDLPGDTAMYISLGLIICGNGFFKPNISTLTG
jgi:POT family proton-dependent oligopeptide transporter